MAETLHVSVPGAQVYVEEYGNRNSPTIVLIPTLLCDRRIFGDQITALAQNFHIVTVDLRGHGGSSSSEERYGITELADDVLAAMDATKVASGFLVGHGLGGIVALQVALKSKARVRGMVLIGSTYQKPSPKRRAQQLAMLGTLRVFGMRRWLVDRAAAVLFGQSYIDSAPDVVALWRERIAALNPKALAQTVLASANRSDLKKHLKSIDVPTLVLHGVDDEDLPLSQGRELADALPTARFQALPATGHMAQLERPHVVSRLIVTFCEGLAAPM